MDIRKRFALISLVLSIICLTGNLALMVVCIIDGEAFWKNLANILLMLAIAYTSYKTYKN